MSAGLEIFEEDFTWRYRIDVPHHVTLAPWRLESGH
jgi:hypothetical protein